MGVITWFRESILPRWRPRLYSCCASSHTSGSSRTWDPSANISIRIKGNSKTREWERGGRYAYPFGGGVGMALGLLDSVPVGLVRLIMGGVILRFRHVSLFFSLLIVTTKRSQQTKTKINWKFDNINRGEEYELSGRAAASPGRRGGWQSCRGFGAVLWRLTNPSYGLYGGAAEITKMSRLVWSRCKIKELGCIVGHGI